MHSRVVPQTANVEARLKAALVERMVHLTPMGRKPIAYCY